jgi:hypothetical protein|tara:strand:- start:1263 stop:1448 length:186 start_codon:yes stop_codon:yes gene_type:complete
VLPPLLFFVEMFINMDKLPRVLNCALGRVVVLCTAAVFVERLLQRDEPGRLLKNNPGIYII